MTTPYLGDDRDAIVQAPRPLEPGCVARLVRARPDLFRDVGLEPTSCRRRG